MAISLATFGAQVDGLISADNDILSNSRREDLIKMAIEQYSIDRPDEITVDVTGDDGQYYSISTSFSSWEEGFSRVVSIQYPAPTVADDEAPVYLEPEAWDDNYWDASIRYLYLPNHSPPATEELRVVYTAPYLWTGSTTDTPEAHFFTICLLAAGYCAQAIAAKFSSTTDSTISVDSVDHLSRAQQWSIRAKEFMALYNKNMGLDKDAETYAAGEFVDWDNAPNWPASRRYLFHGSETR